MPLLLPPGSPGSPNRLLFPLKMLSRLRSVTGSITNVTQLVWQDVILFFFTHTAPTGHDSLTGI